MNGTADFDDLVIGTGMAGLTVGALLANAGRRVLLLEAHDMPGGYAHTFQVRDFRFCAQVHYIFNCGEGESIHSFLQKIGAADRVPFVRLDVEGFDHVLVGDEPRIRIPNGLPKYRARLVRRFPQWEKPINRYFHVVTQIAEQLDRLDVIPEKLTARFVVGGVYRFRHLLRYMRSTLEDFYNEVAMPQLLRAILAGQSGDYLLPPRDVSFLLHVALIHSYDRGAYYPEKHFFQFIDTIAKSITDKPGCAILLEHEVEQIHVDGGRVAGVTTKNGKRFTAQRYVSNMDPRVTAKLANRKYAGKALSDYEYSCGTVTMYLAVRDLDLREHGFGSHNVWHYPHADINRIYDDQLVRHDLSNPWLFMSTPTLHSDAPGLCPPGHQILEIATCCDYARFARMRESDRRAYNQEKKKIRENILDLIEARYVPSLRDHLALRLTGTPATNARFCRAPEGNSYGAALTPKNMGVHRRPQQMLDNLWTANATAGLPSVAGAMGAGMRLYQTLTGDTV